MVGNCSDSLGHEGTVGIDGIDGIDDIDLGIELGIRS
jgi:hypothetical protein